MTRTVTSEQTRAANRRGEVSDKNYYILLGGAEHFDFFIHNDKYADQQWFWSAPQKARRGDIGFVYLTAPVSRIVGLVEIMGEPFYNVNGFQNPKTKNRWMAEVGNVVYFFPRADLTMSGLRKLFDDWDWLRYPRSSTKIPAHIIEPFLEMIAESDAQWSEPCELPHSAFWELIHKCKR